MNKIIILLSVLVIFTLKVNAKNNFKSISNPSDSLSDIFPLSIGNQWTYSYSYNSNAFIQGYLSIDGTISMEIIDKVSMTDSTIWKVQITNNLLYHYENGNTPKDTSIDTINIIEYNTGLHKLSNNSFPFYSLPFDSITLNRFAIVDSSLRWSFEIENDNMKYLFEFEKGIGAVSYSATDMCTCLYYWYASYSLISHTITGVGKTEAINNNVVLQQNYPNPFNPITTISFSLPAEMYVSLKIYNSIGKEISTIVSGYLSSGSHKFRWDGSNLSSGIYFYRLNYGRTFITKKLILLK
jgi:hypothetical protein